VVFDCEGCCLPGWGGVSLVCVVFEGAGWYLTGVGGV
jgi:predicted nucleic acid-binding Zn ribbon protein